MTELHVRTLHCLSFLQKKKKDVVLAVVSSFKTEVTTLWEKGELTLKCMFNLTPFDQSSSKEITNHLCL